MDAWIKRSEERFEACFECNLYDGQRNTATALEAKTRDISKSGLGIRYLGAPLKKDSEVVVYLKDMDLRKTATVVWCRRHSNINTLAGLRFSMAIPRTLIASHIKA